MFELNECVSDMARTKAGCQVMNLRNRRRQCRCICMWHVGHSKNDWQHVASHRRRLVDGSFCLGWLIIPCGAFNRWYIL